MQQKLIDLERDFCVRTHLTFDKVLCDELAGEVFSHDPCSLRRHQVRSLWESRWMRACSYCSFGTPSVSEWLDSLYGKVDVVLAPSVIRIEV